MSTVKYGVVGDGENQDPNKVPGQSPDVRPSDVPGQKPAIQEPKQPLEQPHPDRRNVPDKHS